MYGVHPNSLLWFIDYLRNRLQNSKVNGAVSKTRTIIYGVSQGSILGPLLFIIYVNDITKYISESKVSRYVDDMSLYTSSQYYINIILNLRIDIEAVYQWLRANKLSINVKK